MVNRLLPTCCWWFDKIPYDVIASYVIGAHVSKYASIFRVNKIFCLNELLVMQDDGLWQAHLWQAHLWQAHLWQAHLWQTQSAIDDY